MRYTKSIISLIITLRDRKYNIPSVVIVVSKPSDPIQKKINSAQFFCTKTLVREIIYILVKAIEFCF